MGSEMCIRDRFTALGYAQVGINTNTPDASSALEIESTTGGILIPRLTETQRDAISAPATGLMIYQTNGTSGFYFYDGNSAIPNAFGINIGTGSLNTDEIISVFGVNGNNYAAKLTYEYNGGGYDDWFLPSLQELNEILANKTIVNSTCTSNGGTSLLEVSWYWSSSVGTADNNRVWEVDMSNGNNAEALRGGNNNIVRAVRAF